MSGDSSHESIVELSEAFSDWLDSDPMKIDPKELKKIERLLYIARFNRIIGDQPDSDAYEKITKHMEMIYELKRDAPIDDQLKRLLRQFETGTQPKLTSVDTPKGEHREAAVIKYLARFPDVTSDEIAKLIGDGMTGNAVRNTEAWKHRAVVQRTEGPPKGAKSKDGDIDAYDHRG